MQAIFDDDPLPKVDLRHDTSWKSAIETEIVKTVQEAAVPESLTSSVQPVFVQCVRSIKDQTFVETRERETCKQPSVNGS